MNELDRVAILIEELRKMAHQCKGEKYTTILGEASDRLEALNEFMDFFQHIGKRYNNEHNEEL